MYVGQNLENLGQTVIFMQRGRAFVIGSGLQMALDWCVHHGWSCDPHSYFQLGHCLIRGITIYGCIYGTGSMQIWLGASH